MCVLGVVSVSRIQDSGPGQSLAVSHGDAGEAGAPLPGNTPRSPAHIVPLLRGSPTCFPRPPLCRGDRVSLRLFLVWGGSWRAWGLL